MPKSHSSASAPSSQNDGEGITEVGFYVRLIALLGAGGFGIFLLVRGINL